MIRIWKTESEQTFYGHYFIHLLWCCDKKNVSCDFSCRLSLCAELQSFFFFFFLWIDLKGVTQQNLLFVSHLFSLFWDQMYQVVFFFPLHCSSQKQPSILLNLIELCQKGRTWWYLLFFNISNPFPEQSQLNQQSEFELPAKTKTIFCFRVDSFGRG